MGLELKKDVTFTADPWIITESDGDSPQYVAQAHLQEEVTNQKDLTLTFLKPHHTDTGNTMRTRTYWYDLKHLPDGVYEARSTQHPRFPCRAWFQVQGQRIIHLAEQRQDALRWFGVHRLVVPFSCGHDHAITIYGPPERATQAFQAYLGWKCTDCYRVAKYLAAKQTAERLECPPLFGTPKQIEWAEQIRAKILEPLMALELEWEMLLALLQERGIDDPDAYVVGQLKRHESAAFWIDHRYLDLWGFLRLLHHEDGY